MEIQVKEAVQVIEKDQKQQAMDLDERLTKMCTEVKQNCYEKLEATDKRLEVSTRLSESCIFKIDHLENTFKGDY